MESQEKDASSEASERIKPRLIEEEMKSSYLDYAMSVIVGRALPDVRDGLKPVHRRILFAMHDMGMLPNKPYKKSARIVGECLGKYHPHGDSAVYDSMVRMAQNWSLRYPLIDGQGNFGCFTQDTEVQLTDGRKLSFKDLIKEYEQGKKNYTYTVNSEGMIEIAEIIKPRLTKRDQKIMKVVLDNDQEIKCTLNHKFMLKDGTYRSAQYLNEGDSLMPLYDRLSTSADNKDVVGYTMVYQPISCNWEFAHHFADLYNLKQGIYSVKAGRVRHHIDFKKLNNNPENIRRMQWADHWRLHAMLVSQRHKDIDYVMKIAEGRKRFWANAENKKKYSDRLSIRNKENWKDEAYRKKMSSFLSEMNNRHIEKYPELRIIRSEQATKTLKRLWKDPSYRKLFHEKIVASNKRRTTNNTGKVKFMKICDETVNLYGLLDERHYEKVRADIYSYGSATTWKKGFKKYFFEDKSTLLAEVFGNHKVAKIEFLSERQDVYDLTIDKTHNFALAAGVFVHNSVDGDPAAAMRYTEARLAKISEELLSDIDRDTVDFSPNFDGSLKEPLVLPCRFPNLLVNGSSGIAVGMATNIPPHNLSEVADGVLELIDNPGASVAELMKHVKGPDFPTGGIIRGTSGIRSAYEYGKGKVVVRSKAEIEEHKNRERIIVTEIPYMVNKSMLIEQIADLVKNGNIQGISDIRDESDKDGMRVVIELKSGAASNVILNQLFRHTRMESSFGIIMLSLVDNAPKVLSLKSMLTHFINHRRTVIKRRTQFDLNKAEEKAHILEGLLIALKNIDDIVQKIKRSKDVESAKNTLIDDYSLTEIQAKAILEMKLQKLSSLEQEKIKEEHKKLLELVIELKSILSSEQRILEMIKTDMEELKQKYGDERRTELTVGGEDEITDEDLIPEEEMVVTITNAGYIKRLATDTYKSQGRGGKGIVGTTSKEEDFVEHLFVASTHDYVLFFTNKGKVYWLKVYELPQVSRQAKGKAIVNLIRIEPGERVTAFVPVKQFDDSHYLMMATRKGAVKKSSLELYSHPRKGGIIGIGLNEGDELIDVLLTDGQTNVILATKNGMAIRFNEQDARPMGRTASGVRGIKLKGDDAVVGMVRGQDERTLLTITDNGYGKRTQISEYRMINRGGVGVKNIICSPRNGNAVAILSVVDDDDVMFMSKNGVVIRTPVKGISSIGRATQGFRLMNLKAGDSVGAAAKIIKE